MKYTHLIFDLDGTLINTEEPILKTWQFTLKEYDYSFALEKLKSILGITTKKALEILEVTVDADFEKKWTENYGKFAAEADFFPGTKEMLLELKEHGYFLGVVTSRSVEEYNAYFQKFHLEELFDCIVCADATKKHKPDPEPIYKYAELTKADLSSCIYIGDMPTDMKCAKSAGISAGMVQWNHSEIVCREADHLFRSPEELLKRLL